MSQESEMSSDRARAWIQTLSGLSCFNSGEASGLKGEALRQVQDKYDRLALIRAKRLAAIACGKGDTDESNGQAQEALL